MAITVPLCQIELSSGNFVIVDEDDYAHLSQWRWREHTGTATRNKHVGTIGNWRDGRRKDICIFMHREIMNAPLGMDVDHINGDRLDNRKSNLRVCTHAENRRNTKTPTTNKSGYKGVSWCIRDNKWIAFITLNGKSKNLGRYIDIMDAARAYNNAAIKYFGEYARINKGVSV